VPEFVQKLMDQKLKSGIGAYPTVWTVNYAESSPTRVRKILQEMVEGTADPDVYFLYVLGGNHNLASHVKAFSMHPTKLEFSCLMCNVFVKGTPDELTGVRRKIK
jgi:hypothetical protein